MPRWSISSGRPTSEAKQFRKLIVAYISSIIICFGMRSSFLVDMASLNSSSVVQLSIISLKTEKRTFSLIPSGKQSKDIKLAIGTIPLEITLTSLPSTLRYAVSTPAFSISSAFARESVSPSSASSSPVSGFAIGRISVLPAIRAPITSFLLYLYLPTRDKS